MKTYGMGKIKRYLQKMYGIAVSFFRVLQKIFFFCGHDYYYFDHTDIYIYICFDACL